MKKTMVYVIALTLAFSTLLAGCGEMRGTDGGTTAPTAPPQQTMLPETMMPKPEDGVVTDQDGIITENDNGTVTETAPTTPGSAPSSGSTAPGTAGIGNTGTKSAGMR